MKKIFNSIGVNLIFINKKNYSGIDNKIYDNFKTSEFFSYTRKQTLNLVKNLNPEDMVIQTEPFVSPIKWHLAHTTWFFENFILKKLENIKFLTNPLIIFLIHIITA